MRENAYQAKLIRRIKELLPGCVVLKNDSAYLQGIPDLTILYGERWAMLEVKASAKEPFQPNQEYYIDGLGKMSFCSAIFPENEEEVLNALQRSLQARRAARVSKR